MLEGILYRRFENARSLILFHLFQLMEVALCNALRAQALFSWLVVSTPTARTKFTFVSSDFASACLLCGWTGKRCSVLDEFRRYAMAYSVIGRVQSARRVALPDNPVTRI
jgi:hypothetical protein